jgi:hypothetical protein
LSHSCCTVVAKEGLCVAKRLLPAVACLPACRPELRSYERRVQGAAQQRRRRRVAGVKTTRRGFSAGEIPSHSQHLTATGLKCKAHHAHTAAAGTASGAARGTQHALLHCGLLQVTQSLFLRQQTMSSVTAVASAGCKPDWRACVDPVVANYRPPCQPHSTRRAPHRHAQSTTPRRTQQLSNLKLPN